VQVIFFYAEVTTARLSLLTPLFEKARILPRVGTVLPLSQIRSAHQMLGGAPHQKGKIALQVAT
jgi:NADPH:quinone reductase-like Zn-dependent oxidoreductase